ncbi:acetyl-CoA C-acetyltransferase, partial [Burkholderia dolosa]|nr:acetyl-CoA C-acetyltransferase [Burkholderia dolosa]
MSPVPADVGDRAARIADPRAIYRHALACRIEPCAEVPARRPLPARGIGARTGRQPISKQGLNMTDVVIVSAARTAVGKFGGSLAKIAAPELGATVIRAVLERAG